MSHNPFPSQKSPVANITPLSPPKFLAVAVAILFLIHIIIFFYYFDIYFEPVSTGALAILWPLLGLIADLILFISIVLLLFKKRIEFMFLIAGAIFFVVVGFLWKQPVGRLFILITYGLGAADSFFGWWVVSLYKRRNA